MPYLKSGSFSWDGTSIEIDDSASYVNTSSGKFSFADVARVVLSGNKHVTLDVDGNVG
jgi:hypothetical protein